MVEAYNGTGMTGGSSLAEDLNVWYDVSRTFLQTEGITKANAPQIRPVTLHG
jgi:hypothetical protein